MKVLFVCSGNICRSPIAAACLERRIANLGLGGWQVESAGTLGLEDCPASPEAIEALDEVGIDLRGHRSQGLGRRQLEQADVVIAMSKRHRREVERLGGGRGECRLLRAFEHAATPAADAPDLEDPIGRPVGFYREQLKLIERCVEHLVEHLRSRA